MGCVQPSIDFQHGYNDAYATQVPNSEEKWKFVIDRITHDKFQVKQIPQDVLLLIARYVLIIKSCILSPRQHQAILKLVCHDPSAK